MSQVRMADLYGKTLPLSIQQEALGATFVDSKDRVFQYIQYYDGATIYGIQGMFLYPIGGGTGNVSAYAMTCDNNLTNVKAIGRGIIIPDVVLDTEYCWMQKRGPSLVETYANAAQSAGASLIADNTTVYDGQLEAFTDPGNEELIIADLLAEDETTRTFLRFAPTTNFAVGETITGGTSAATCVIEKIYARGSTQYAFLCNTMSGTWTAAEALTGSVAGVGTLGAAGTYTQFTISPGNLILRCA